LNRSDSSVLSIAQVSRNDPSASIAWSVEDLATTSKRSPSIHEGPFATSRRSNGCRWYAYSISSRTVAFVAEKPPPGRGRIAPGPVWPEVFGLIEAVANADRAEPGPVWYAALMATA
jgi:hypothetical protein